MIKLQKSRLYLFNATVYTFFLYILNFPFNQDFDTFLWGIWFIIGIKIVQLFFKSFNYILSIFILLNIVVTSYFFFIYTNYNLIATKGPFDFSAYTIKNLHNINNLMYLIFTTIYLVLFLNKKNLKNKKNNLIKIRNNFKKEMYKIYKIKNIKIIISIIIFIFLDLLIFIGTYNIYKGPYGVNMDKYFYISNFLRAFIGILSLFIYIIVKIKNKIKFNIYVFLTKLFFFYTLFFTILSFGSRGSAVGIMILLLIFDILTDKMKLIKYINFFTNIIIIFILITLWPFMRGYIYNHGLIESLIYAFDFFLVGTSSFYETQFKMIPMIPMTLFHFLYVSDLISNENSLNYATFINLIPQQLPSFIADIIDYTRPLNDNWILAKYFFHGGGFYIFANAYWNGGVLPLLFFTSFIIQILIWIESFFKRNNPIYYLAYPLFIYLIPVNIFYGIQPFIRGLEYGFVSLIIIYTVRKIKITKRKHIK